MGENIQLVPHGLVADLLAIRYERLEVVLPSGERFDLIEAHRAAAGDVEIPEGARIEGHERLLSDQIRMAQAAMQDVVGSVDAHLAKALAGQEGQ